MKSVGVGIAAVAAGALGWLGFGQPLLGLLGSAMILASTAEYWLGTTYQISAQGASSRTGFSTTSMEWSEVKRVVVSDTELKLSPLEQATTMDAFRGVSLKFGKTNRDSVLACMRRFYADA